MNTKKKSFIKWVLIKLVSKILDVGDAVTVVDLQLQRLGHSKVNYKSTDANGVITFIDVTRTVTNHDIYK